MSIHTLILALLDFIVLHEMGVVHSHEELFVFVTKSLLIETFCEDFATQFQRAVGQTSGMATRRNVTTVCIPAHNEVATIERVIELVDRERLRNPDLVAEILVIDDRSTDGTANVARSLGARVESTKGSILLPLGARGKGDAMALGVCHCKTEFITFLDGDVTMLDEGFVETLVEPMLRSQSTHLVKGSFRRLGARSEPGRVTALTALPLLRLLSPKVADIREPLSGVFSARVDALAGLKFESDYGVDVGILIDVINRYGRDSVNEVDIGALAHRRRDLESLSITAEQVARAILARATSRFAVSTHVRGPVQSLGSIERRSRIA